MTERRFTVHDARRGCPLGLGCMRLSRAWRKIDGSIFDFGAPDRSESIRLVRRAVEEGVGWLDTSDAYGAGDNELMLGQALSGIRDRVVLVSKFGWLFDETARCGLGRGISGLNQPGFEYRLDGAYIRWACEQSLRRLRTDRIDIYLCHIGDGACDDDLLCALEGLVQAGKIRGYGWSTSSAWRIRAMSIGPACSASELALNPAGGDHDALTETRKWGLAPLIRSPLGAGSPLKEKPEDPPELRQLREVLRAGGRSVAQGIIAWLWGSDPTLIPIPGFRSQAQLDDLRGALKHGAFSPEDFSRVDAAVKNYRRLLSATESGDSK